MNIEKLTILEKLVIIRYIRDCGELLVFDKTCQMTDEIEINFNPDKNRIVIRI